MTVEYIKFNVPGIDELFTANGGKVAAGSILALCGGPGTGKTTLALQLAHSIKVHSDGLARTQPAPYESSLPLSGSLELQDDVDTVPRTPPDPATCSAILLTFDGPEEHVHSLAVQYGFTDDSGNPRRGYQRVKCYSLSTRLRNGKTIYEMLQQAIHPMAWSSHSDSRTPANGNGHRVSESRQPDHISAGLIQLISDATEEALDEARRSAQVRLEGQLDPRVVIVLDGLSTMLAYVPPEQKRMVLHFIINRLRDCQITIETENYPALGAGILTFELPISPTAEMRSVSLDAEHYLADVVIWLTLQEGVPGKRKRLFEIIKARRASYALGEHSLWLVNKNWQLKMTTKRLRGMESIQPGVVVFPAHRVEEAIIESTQGSDRRVFESTGLRSLDEMFGKALAADEDHGSMQTGVLRGSTSTILGSAGAGKTLCALAFSLASVAHSENDGLSRRFYCSFDSSEAELLKVYGDFHVDSSPTLYEACKRGQLRLFYRSPDNFDPNFFFWLVKQEVIHRPPIERVVFDNISEVERTFGTGPAFQDFMTNLMGLLKQHQVTTLFTCEHPVDFSRSPSHASPISYMADNVILMAPVAINDVNKKCLLVAKSRGQPSLANPRELQVLSPKPGDGKGITCRVADTFAEYSQLLRGRPEAVQIHLRLFGENQKETDFNLRFVESLRSRYPNVQLSTFTKTDLRETLWEHRGVTRAQALRSDITVVSVDESWFPRLALPQDQRESVLSSLPLHGDDGDLVDPYRSRKLRDFLPQLMLAAQIDGRLYGLPQYYDMGFLFCRTDLMEKQRMRMPTSFGEPEDESDESGAGNGQSWCAAIAAMAKRCRMFSFAFETTIVENLVCPFIEICWNLGAYPDFLHPTQHAHSIGHIDKALRFLSWMVYRRYMPYPCDTAGTSEAVFTRHWYSTFQDMLASGAASAGRYALMEFPAAARVATDRALKDRITAWAKSTIATEGQSLPQEAMTFVSDLGKQYNVECLRDSAKQLRMLNGGWTCSGAWYTGVLRSGRSVNPGWIIAYELADAARVRERAYAGAGLPPTRSFYEINSHRQIPDIPSTTFHVLREQHFPKARHRYDAFGFDNPSRSRMAYENFADELYVTLSEFLAGSVHKEASLDVVEMTRKKILEVARGSLPKEA